jgi:hypothetical protein
VVYWTLHVQPVADSAHSCSSQLDVAKPSSAADASFVSEGICGCSFFDWYKPTPPLRARALCNPTIQCERCLQ